MIKGSGGVQASFEYELIQQKGATWVPSSIYMKAFDAFKPLSQGSSIKVIKSLMMGFEFGKQKAHRIRQQAIQKCHCLGNDWGYLGIRVNKETTILAHTKRMIESDIAPPMAERQSG